ncbi:hypothetical protein Vadar_027698 [Vaccinium darrowii]|uniref:Uncharacterized protein n=1 Tax=Vaccinium darrowii TaxID=229202 RepID=A0ACB7Y270_9ERIC|nr:hypothetical protein Vadar_027698 [Vaccinium darrowii]
MIPAKIEFGWAPSSESNSGVLEKLEVPHHLPFPAVSHLLLFDGRSFHFSLQLPLTFLLHILLYFHFNLQFLRRNGSQRSFGGGTERATEDPYDATERNMSRRQWADGEGADDRRASLASEEEISP